MLLQKPSFCNHDSSAGRRSVTLSMCGGIGEDETCEMFSTMHGAIRSIFNYLEFSVGALF